MASAPKSFAAIAGAVFVFIHPWSGHGGSGVGPQTPAPSAGPATLAAGFAPALTAGLVVAAALALAAAGVALGAGSAEALAEGAAEVAAEADGVALAVAEGGGAGSSFGGSDLLHAVRRVRARARESTERMAAA